LPFAQEEYAEIMKYNSKPVTIDNHRFPSQLEGRRYCELKLLLVAGEITDLELQPKFPLVVNGHKIGVYTADFRYKVVATGEVRIEDAKGYITKDFVRTKKLFEAIYEIPLYVV